MTKVSEDNSALKETLLKKRPWRNKVRKLAKKKAAQEAKKLDKNSMKKPKKKITLKKVVTTEIENNASKEIQLPLKECESKLDAMKEKLESGRFRFLNEQLYTSTGEESLKYFSENEDAFWVYHKGFAKQVEKWPNHPLITIIQWLNKQKESKVVYDLGCGEAKIAEAVSDRHKVISFDLVAVNNRVTVADMAHLPVEVNSADIVIFCLSLMGTNTLDFIKEARRVLKTGGILKIAEVSSRFQNIKRFCDALCMLGFTKTEKRDLTDYFILLQFTKIAKVENKRPLGLKLKPCLYKKR